MTKRSNVPDKADSAGGEIESSREEHTEAGLLLLRAVAVSSSHMLQKQLVPTMKGIRAFPNRAP